MTGLKRRPQSFLAQCIYIFAIQSRLPFSTDNLILNSRFLLLTKLGRFPRAVVKDLHAEVHEAVVVGQVDNITDERAFDAEHVLAGLRLEQV